MKYISEVIGEEYKEWESPQVIFVKSPTGSGKTTFILNELLSFAAMQGRKILYLVNRKILKEQIQNELKDNLYKIGRMNI